MIIHINPTLQSYLVLEKKIIYFLEHAGVRGWLFDMNIQWTHSLPLCATLAVCSRALPGSGLVLDSVAGPPRQDLLSAPARGPADQNNETKSG